MINDGADSILESFISRRWTRALIPVQIQAARARYGEIDVEKEKLINGLYSDLDLIVRRLRHDNKKLREVSECFTDMKSKYGVDNYIANSAEDKVEALRECYGVDAPDEPAVLLRNT